MIAHVFNNLEHSCRFTFQAAVQEPVKADKGACATNSSTAMNDQRSLVLQVLLFDASPEINHLSSGGRYTMIWPSRVGILHEVTCLRPAPDSEASSNKGCMYGLIHVGNCYFSMLCRWRSALSGVWPVAMTFELSCLHLVCHHDNDVGVVLPDHLPKASHGVWDWTLSCDIVFRSGSSGNPAGVDVVIVQVHLVWRYRNTTMVVGHNVHVTIQTLIASCSRVIGGVAVASSESLELLHEPCILVLAQRSKLFAQGADLLGEEVMKLVHLIGCKAVHTRDQFIWIKGSAQCRIISELSTRQRFDKLLCSCRTAVAWQALILAHFLLFPFFV
eukprot:m.100730 g.100730  ORF g.100730 m.100730 type:complete len:330 (-) comp14951_c0_seq1:140-1129(-)